MFKELYLDFFIKNKKIFFFYLITIIFIFPFRAFGISKLNSKMFSSIKKSNFENVFNLNKITVFPNIIIAIFGAWLITILADYIKNYLQSDIFPMFIQHIRTTIFNKTIEGHENKYKDLLVGKEIASVIEISNQSKNILELFSKYWFPLGFIVLFVNIYLFFNYKKIFLPIFFGTILITMIIFYNYQKCIELARKKYIKFLDANEKINDNYTNLMNIYINNQQKNTINDYKQLENKKKKKDTEFMKEVSRLIFYINIIVLLSVVLALFLSYKMFLNSEINKEEIIFIFLILISYISFSSDSTNILHKVFDKLGVVSAESEHLEFLFKKKQKNNKNNYSIKNGSIDFRNVTFKYPDQKSNQNIINRINFSINANEKIALIGCSGCGKSTIIKLLINMYSINYGKILIDNVDIRDYNVHYLREQVNYVNQKTILFDENIIENIKKGNSIEDKQIISLLKSYKLENVFSKLKKGIYSKAGVGGNNLSLGMQKVTIIIRGILKEGKIIIFDEPLAGLDKDTRKKIIKLIKDTCKHKTVIIISHNKELLPLVDRVIDIKDI